MAALRKAKRIGKRASKFQFSATYQSTVIECQNDKWTPHMISIAFHRRGRRIVSKMLPWLPSPDNPLRGIVVWSEPETVEAPITLYKGPKDKSFETKEWEFSIINIDKNSHRKVLATVPVNLVQYASALPFEHELQLKLRPVSVKIKKVLLEVSLSSVLLKEGKATDDDMISIASMMSVSNLSTIGNLEDDEDYTINRFGMGRSISPAMADEAIPSTEKLLEWSQEITKEYSNIRVMNMTTSWRNGLGFCAIIHHYRPDLLEYHQLSSQSIKENNRLAFTIAQELGIACPLTPNMMLLSDIPDKLAVSAFVYQMYNYFTRAVHSAITKPSPTQLIKGVSSPTATSPLGSFDISKFEEFSFNISATSPDGEVPSTRSLSGTNIYSRHSQTKAGEVDTPPLGETSNKDTPTGSNMKNESTQKGTPTQLIDKDMSTQETEAMIPSNQTTPPSNQSDTSCETPPLDNKRQIHSTPKDQPKNDTSFDSMGVVNEDSMGVVNEDSVGVVNDESSKRSLMKSNKSFTNILINPNNDNSGRGSPQQEKIRRASLPNSPTEEKKSSDFLRRKARDMLKSHGVDKVKTVDAISMNTRRRLQEARQKSHGSLPHTPPLPIRSLSNSRSDSRLPQVPVNNGENNNYSNEIIQEFTGLQNVSENHNQDSSQNSVESNVQTNTSPVNDRNKEDTNIQQPLSGVQDTSQARTQTKTVDTHNDIQSGTSQINTLQQFEDSERESQVGGDSHQRHSEGVLNRQQLSQSNEVQKTTATNNKNNNKLRTRFNSIGGEGFQPTAPSSRPSSAARKMAKKPPKEKQEVKKEVEKNEEEVRTKNRPNDVCIITTDTDSPQQQSSLDSPLTWVNHEHNLHNDILLSQSDYVKTELTKLHSQLKPLEERASVIERDIRDAMGQGDSEREELLTVEYFKILNEKNALIKKQIELNLLEKEEDLEKRQFFINRELRPLAALSDEEKTPKQKEREDQLLKELIELVNERQWLDQRLTNTSSTKEESLSPKEAPPIRQTSLSFSASTKARFTRERAGSKDCVIS